MERMLEVRRLSDSRWELVGPASAMCRSDKPDSGAGQVAERGSEVGAAGVAGAEMLRLKGRDSVAVWRAGVDWPGNQTGAVVESHGAAHGAGSGA